MPVDKAKNQTCDDAQGAVEASKAIRTIELPHYQAVPHIRFDDKYHIAPSVTRVILYYFCEHLENGNDALMRIPAFFVNQKIKQICKENGAFRNMERSTKWKDAREYPHGIFFETWKRHTIPKEFKPLADIRNLVTFPLVLGNDIWTSGRKPGAVRIVRGKKANGEIIHDIIYHAKPDNKMKMATLKAGVLLPHLQFKKGQINTNHNSCSIMSYS